MKIRAKRARSSQTELSSVKTADIEARELKKVRWEENAETLDVEDNYDSEDQEMSDKICLSCWCLHRRLGAAFYEPAKNILYILEDTEESPHFDLLNLLLEQFKPDVTLTSSKADDESIDFLREHMDEAGGIFQIRPYKDFTPSKGRDRLLSLPLLLELRQEDHGGEQAAQVGPKSAYDFMKMRKNSIGDLATKKWNAAIRLSSFAAADSSPLCMASVGALLDHLARERAVNSLDDNGDRGIHVAGIETMAFEQFMQINADALSSLQIFETECHASVHSDRTKEGLSLYGILNGTKTALGRALLRMWLLRPSLSLSTINSRHDAVACFSDSENMLPSRTIHTHLRGIKNVPRILNLVRTGRARLPDWHGLVKFTFHAVMIRDTISELHQAADLEITQKLIAALDVRCLREVGVKINGIIDWEESAEAGRVCVRHHVDEELDNRKHVYHGIDSVLSKVAQQISDQVPFSYAASLNVVYFPQLGFLICIPMAEEWQADSSSIQTLEGWTFQFSSNAHVYFKSEKMHDMDTHIGDLHSAIVDRELEIIQNLEEQILKHDESIRQACEVCAELDCLLSFAEASRTYNYYRPRMVQDNIIDICNGRHPLQEQVVDVFVPNGAFIVGRDGGSVLKTCAGNSVLICTGANACGKSVYLKQIALIQYMAQIGCFVPAEAATLGIVDKIFTRISTRESVSRVQSAFMIDLNQVSFALRNCTARSLILLDEFGKGTLATDGAGLFCGVINHLLGRGEHCPKVLVATHFHDVFQRDLIDPETALVTFCHMQVMFTSSDGRVLAQGDCTPGSQASETRDGVHDKITYLFKVANGLSLDSHAAKCASLFGLPARLVARAQYVSHLLSTYNIGQLLDEEMSEAERKKLEAAEAVCRRFLTLDLDAADASAHIKEKLAWCFGTELTG